MQVGSTEDKLSMRPLAPSPESQYSPALCIQLDKAQKGHVGRFILGQELAASLKAATKTTRISLKVDLNTKLLPGQLQMQCQSNDRCKEGADMICVKRTSLWQCQTPMPHCLRDPRRLILRLVEGAPPPLDLPWQPLLPASWTLLPLPIALLHALWVSRGGLWYL